MQVPPKHEIMVKIQDEEFVNMFDCRIRDPKICDVVFKEFFKSVKVDNLTKFYKGVHCSRSATYAFVS